jgi:glycerol kinase
MTQDTSATIKQSNHNHHNHHHHNRMGLKRRSNTLNSTGATSLGEPEPQYGDLIGAIDQGTSSTRFLAFEKGTGRLVASSQIEIKRLTPREGWVEIDPNAIMSSVYATMANVHDQLLAKQHQLTTTATTTDDFGNHPSVVASNNQLLLLKCIGICNQRESAVVWDATTGQPLYNVIVWMDNRTKDIVDDMIDSIPGRDFNRLKDKTGLPMSTYFSAFKLKWLIDNVPEVKRARDDKRLLVGTVDSWILWNLTGQHLTDVTNASRTFLMDIETLEWDKSLCKQFKVPMEVLPKILSSADDFGTLQFGPFMGTPITGVIGDQSAALFGHNCLQLGQTKATFGK